MHVRGEADEPHVCEVGLRSNLANGADRIEFVAIEVEDDEVRLMRPDARQDPCALADERGPAAERVGDGPDFRAEQQVVDDGQDHARMIRPLVRIVSAAAPPFFKNGYVVWCDATREGVVIDPGDDVDDLLGAVREHGLAIRFILLTHAHLDHVTGVARAKAALDAPIWLHRDDLFLYEGAVQQGAMFGLRVEPPPPVDEFYEPPQQLRFGEHVVDVLHTPGHCPGGVCLAIGRAGSAARALFVGDTLFAGSIGRTDLPGGDLGTLLASIRSVLFAFPDDTVVHSGHGPETTIGEERRTNPFLTAPD